ncbi:MAG: hypothetical protein JRF63_11325 [Deltaproteobacteria bacterium]|nr:hypothetical protein [Deltaproteobacteria bacterium]
MKKTLVTCVGWIAACLALLLFVGCSDAIFRANTDDDDNDDNDDNDADDTGSETEGDCGLSEMETFDTQIPAGWTVVDGGTSAGAWVWTDDIPSTFPVAIVSDGGAFIDSQAAGNGPVQDDDLESPLYNLGDCTSAILSYDYNFQKDLVGSDAGEVYLLPGGGGSPILLAAYTSDSSSNELESATIPITATELGDESSFRIVFHYEGSFDLGFYIDKVGVEGVP